MQSSPPAKPAFTGGEDCGATELRPPGALRELVKTGHVCLQLFRIGIMMRV